MDPEDFSDGPRHENRVADQARNRQEAGDQPGPEQQQTQEDAPDSERHLGDLVGHGVRLDRERPEGFGPTHARLPGVNTLLGQGNDHQQSEHPDVQQDHLDNHRGQVGQRGSLAVLLQDREEQNPLPHIHRGVQQHQKGSEDQDGLMCGNRREKVRGAGNGSHQAEPTP